MPEQFGFEVALKHLKDGRSVSRIGWNGASAGLSMEVTMQMPDENSKMTKPYIFMMCEGDRIPWQPSQLDLLSADWIIA